MSAAEKQRFASWINELKGDNEAECKKLIQQTLYTARRRAVSFAPVDKGFLRQRINVSINSDGMGGAVWSSVKYAPYQEFGTRPRAIIPSDAGDYGIDPTEWKVPNPKRLTNVRPSPYILPAMRLGNREMILKLKAMGFNERPE
jgi:hypothetical protein